MAAAVRLDRSAAGRLWAAIDDTAWWLEENCILLSCLLAAVPCGASGRLPYALADGAVRFAKNVAAAVTDIAGTIV